MLSANASITSLILNSELAVLLSWAVVLLRRTDNSVSDAGASALAIAMAKNKKITNTEVSCEGPLAETMLEMNPISPSLRKQVTQSRARERLRLLSLSRQVQVLRHSTYQVSLFRWRGVAWQRSVKTSRPGFEVRAQRLFCSLAIGDIGASALAEAVEGPTALASVNLRGMFAALHVPVSYSCHYRDVYNAFNVRRTPCDCMCL